MVVDDLCAKKESHDCLLNRKCSRCGKIAECKTFCKNKLNTKVLKLCSQVCNEAMQKKREKNREYMIQYKIEKKNEIREKARIKFREDSSNQTIKQERRDANKRHYTKTSRTLRGLTLHLIKGAKARVKLRGKGQVSITYEWLYTKMEKGLCEQSSPPISLIFDQPNSPYSPSLDRIDSNNYDYSPENTCLTCVQINIARRDFDDVSSADILSKAGEYFKQKTQIIS